MVNYYITESSAELSVLNSTIYGSITIDTVIPISGLTEQQLIEELLGNNFNVNDKVFIDMINVADKLNIILNSGYTEYILYYSTSSIISNPIDCQCTKNGIYKLIFDISPTNSLTFNTNTCNFNHNNISEINMQVVSVGYLNCEISFEDNSIVTYTLPTSSDQWSLNLSYNNITSFELSDPRIYSLKLNNNSLSSFTMGNSYSGSVLNNIDLSHCLLQTIDFGNLIEACKQLNIGYNRLSTINGVAVALDEIKCNDNKLTTLPSLATSIKIIDISNNPLTSNQIDISTFTALTTLNISNCGQTSLSASPSSTLISLDVSNSVSTFDFSQYANLQTLNISNCGYTNLNSLSNLQSLTYLDVSRNVNLDITNLPSANITTLKCSGCKSFNLGIIPTNILNLDISYLKTSFNGTAIDLSSKTSLENLNIAGIYTENNALNIITLPNSTITLDISYNYLASMPIISNVTDLSMAGLVINNVAIDSISTLGLSTNVQNLKMDNNIQITNLDLSGFTNLQHIICKYCRITNLILPNSIISLDCKGNNISSITYNESEYTTVPDFYYGLYGQTLKPYACFVSLNNLSNPEYCTRMTGMGIKNFYPQASSLDFAYNNTKVISSNFAGYQTYKNWCLKLSPNTTIIDQNADIVNYSTTILDRNANVIVDFNGNNSYGNAQTISAAADQIDKFCSQIDIPNFELIIYWLNISNLLINGNILISILNKFAEKQLRTVIYTNDEYSVNTINSIVQSEYIVPKLISINGIGNTYYITALDSPTQNDIHLVSNFKYEDGTPKLYDIVNSNIIDVANQSSPISYSLTENIQSTYIIEMDIIDETNVAKMNTAIQGLYLANSDNKDNIIINIIPYSKSSNIGILPLYYTSYSYGFKLNGSFIYDIPIGKNIYSSSGTSYNQVFLSSLALTSLDLSQVSVLSALDISYNNLSEFSIYSNGAKKTYTRVIDVYNDLRSGMIADISAFYRNDNVKLIDIRMNFLNVDNIIDLPYNADIALMYPQKMLNGDILNVNGFNSDITNNRFILNNFNQLVTINTEGTVEKIEPEINSNLVFNQSTIDNHCYLYNNYLLTIVMLNRIYDFNNVTDYGVLNNEDLENVLTSYDGSGNYYSVFYNIDNIISNTNSTLYKFISNFGKGTEKMTIYTNTSTAVNAINAINNSHISAMLAIDSGLKPTPSNQFNLFLIV